MYALMAWIASSHRRHPVRQSQATLIVAVFLIAPGGNELMNCCAVRICLAASLHTGFTWRCTRSFRPGLAVCNGGVQGTAGKRRLYPLLCVPAAYSEARCSVTNCLNARIVPPDMFARAAIRFTRQRKRVANRRKDIYAIPLATTRRTLFKDGGASRRKNP